MSMPELAIVIALPIVAVGLAGGFGIFYAVKHEIACFKRNPECGPLMNGDNATPMRRRGHGYYSTDAAEIARAQSNVGFSPDPLDPTSLDLQAGSIELELTSSHIEQVPRGDRRYFKKQNVDYERRGLSTHPEVV